MTISRQMLAALLALLLFASVSEVAAQSGRRKDPPKKPAKILEGPIADPARTGTSSRKPENKATTKTDEQGEEIDEADILRVSSNLVPIPASVVDARGTAVTGLKLEDFELLVDGQPRPISEITRAESSVRLVMLFDNSGSLDFAREFEKRAAMHFFRRVLRPIDEAAIFSIELESYLAQPLTRNISLLEQTILGFGRPQGGTSLFDAVIAASAYLRPQPSRRVLVIVSDGVENTSSADFATMMERVLADDAQVFVVQTGLYEGANLRALAAERRMEELSGQTGGAVYIPKTTSDLERAFEEIAADLAQQYVLSYYPASQPHDGSFHRIELRVKNRRDVRIRARKGYYSPKPANVAAREW